MRQGCKNILNRVYIAELSYRVLSGKRFLVVRLCALERSILVWAESLLAFADSSFAGNKSLLAN